ncbi:MAG: activase [Deltaproteobacteria bacterium]|nr:activase [Deltaproteobacteria bacterium]
MKTLGICVGATNLSAVGVEKQGDGTIKKTVLFNKSHDGNPRRSLLDVFEKTSWRDYDRIAVTGRKFRQAVRLTSIAETEAVEEALHHLNGQGRHFDAVISAGGETCLVYVLGRDGRISSVQTGNKCASGTGEFFMQQIGRLGLSLQEAFRYAREEEPYRVSGRCSVFCKSDCTHAANKGIPKGRIAAGLCEMMAVKILEMIKQIPRHTMMIIGGTAQNPVMIGYLQREIEQLIVPEEAPYFEALGSALWALKHETAPFPGSQSLFGQAVSSFSTLSPLSDYEELVEFRTAEGGVAREGDRCILGLDVGSTTTKAVLMRQDDELVFASVYLRTNGNPVQASRDCYASLCDRLGAIGDGLRIVGLGVTGSGRQIAGLHAMTGGIVNEIIAHAAAALHYDPEVDTIFEIGGQDAKYTYIRNGIPSDYAMNDACSAGTGSFLEESARETMGIAMEEIGDLAMMGKAPPNFNDQCAAFISSDIKNAAHEGLSREDIVAGLVYSICMNYSNRVKGNRSVGDRIFMQGGVCYNRAVPVAMAALTGKRIVVPPEPGLMGAFGVALEIKRRMKLGLLEEGDFSLKTLRDRRVDYGKPFICKGGKEKCDRKCEIARIEIDGKTYPFGGACNRWYNLRFSIETDTGKLNLVRRHEQLIFDEPAGPPPHPPEERAAPVIGLNKSFQVNALLPLYRHFFERIGFRIVVSEGIRQKGIERKRAPFCYPAELAHGLLSGLLEGRPDYLFLPQINGLFVEKGCRDSTTCPIVQAEPHYLASAFKDHEVFRSLKASGRVLSPVIDFSKGYARADKSFSELAVALGCDRRRAREAYAEAVAVQERVQEDMAEEGRRFLEEIEKDSERCGIVLLGRSYNAFVTEANMGIPHKFATRGVPVIPVNFLPIADEPLQDDMYWSSGQTILKGAAFVERHPQLFGCYITNFSCGPDSFLVGYFSRIMGRKPFLILELDSHVADAGLETRIEAFLDIVRNYRELSRREGKRGNRRIRKAQPAYFDPARQEVVDSQGRNYPLTHPRVHLVFPSMGYFLLREAAALFRSLGIRATALPPAGEEVLKLGRGNTSCKECLPLLLTTGTLLKYLKEREDPEELLVYFMPTTSGPCRFGQYSPFIHQQITEAGIENVALLSLNAANGYRGVFDAGFTLRIWICMMIADAMQAIYPILLANAVEPAAAVEIYEREQNRIVEAIERSNRFGDLRKILSSVSASLEAIPLKRTLAETPTVLLTGEIFVRHDDISRQFLVEKLAGYGLATKVAGIGEWVYYTDWCYKNRVEGRVPGFGQRLSLQIRLAWMRHYERVIKTILSRSGLIRPVMEDVDHLIHMAQPLINPRLTGEAILTVGAAVAEVPEPYCGAIAIGPFGCMPNRISEAILTREMSRGWREHHGKKWDSLEDVDELPFLAIESDGNPFPQIITAKMEVFVMQALRLHEKRMKQGT